MKRRGMILVKDFCLRRSKQVPCYGTPGTNAKFHLIDFSDTFAGTKPAEMKLNVLPLSYRETYPDSLYTNILWIMQK
jgi:hypothetical protein